MFVQIENLIFITILTIVGAVPPDYCFQPLNKSDCNQPPKAVFSFYKPGSRCEIEIWRGCPTYNKFDNEFICSHYCIGRLFDTQIEEKQEVLPPMPGDVELDDYCSRPLNPEDCQYDPIKVYTYRNHECVQMLWHGCETVNSFWNKKECEETCIPHAQNSWMGKIEYLALQDISNIENIIDETLKKSNVVIPLNYLQGNTTHHSVATVTVATTSPPENVTDVAIEEATEASEAASEVAEATEAEAEVTEAEADEPESTTEALNNEPATEDEGSADEVVTT